jgi:hypothetical protein
LQFRPHCHYFHGSSKVSKKEIEHPSSVHAFYLYTDKTELYRPGIWYIVSIPLSKVQKKKKKNCAVQDIICLRSHHKTQEFISRAAQKGEPLELFLILMYAPEVEERAGEWDDEEQKDG